MKEDSDHLELIPKPTDRELIGALTDIVTSRAEYNRILNIIVVSERDDFFIVYTKEDANDKRDLRDNFFKKKLGLIPENIEKKYHFLVNKNELLKNKEIVDEIQLQRNTISAQTLREEEIQKLSQDRKNLITLTTVLNIFFSLPGCYEWYIKDDQILVYAPNDPGNKDIKGAEFNFHWFIYKETLPMSLFRNILEIDDDLIRKLRENIMCHWSKSSQRHYYIISTPLLILQPILQRIQKLERSSGITLMLQCRQIPSSDFWYGKIFTESFQMWLEKVIATGCEELEEYRRNIENKILGSFPEKNLVGLVLDYLFFRLEKPTPQFEKVTDEEYEALFRPEN